jgi:hypothetical protein
MHELNILEQVLYGKATSNSKNIFEFLDFMLREKTAPEANSSKVRLLETQWDFTEEPLSIDRSYK